MKKRILILSDSLALPRNKPETCDFESTWPQLLKRDKLLEIHQCSIGGATITELLRQAPYYISFCPDIVIIQVGIVDCVPRFISKKEKYLLSKIPLIGNFLIKGLNSSWFRKKRNITYTTKKTFTQNVKRLKEIFENTSEVFFVEIICGQGYDKLLPGVYENIRIYNKLIAQNNNVIYYKKSEITMSDFHHLNEKGHLCLFNAIKETMSFGKSN